MVFFSAAYVEHADLLSRIVLETLGPGVLLGVSADGVISGSTERERTPAVSVFAATLPGTELHTFTTDDLPLTPAERDGGTDESARAMAKAIGAEPKHGGTLFFSDAFSVPLIRLLPELNNAIGAHGGRRPGPLVGGVASAGESPGGNALLINGTVRRDGGVGITLRGDTVIDAVVSQGCRPVGDNMVVTKARGNLILQLGGRPAVEAVQEAVNSLDDGDRGLLKQGLYLGTVVNEYKDRFGRGDYLIRALLAADERSGAVAVGDMVRVGQTVRLHLRDAQTATEDLELLLDAQKLHERPAGGLLFTCNGRGERLFSTPNHDAGAVTRAFAPPERTAATSMGGTPINAPDPSLPLAGFFAGGEIGPVGPRSYLHGHTASLALFRRRTS